MTAVGSGGAITEPGYILNQMPYAHGLQFEQLYWARQNVAVLQPSSARSQGLHSIL